MEEIREDTYKSKTGFITVPVLRGGYEIRNLNLLVKSYNGFICGGYVRWMCSPTPNPKHASDVDIYSYTAESYLNLLSYFKSTGLAIKHENENAVTFAKPKDTNHLFFALPNIQLIKPINEGAMVAVGDMETVVSNFDFTVIRIGLQSEYMALADADFIHDETNSILRLKNIHCPISSTLRCMKYAAKGYWLPVTQCLRLFIDWDERDDSYREKLLDFLEKAEKDGKLTRQDIDEFEKLARID